MIVKIHEYQVIIDDEDYDKLKLVNWSVHSWKLLHRGQIYFSGGYKGGVVELHRYLFNALDSPLYVDHINGDTLDNRKCNFRLCTNSQNIANQKKNKRNSSGYKGVYWDTYTSNWKVCISLNGKQIHIGRYTDKIEAAKVYDKKAVEMRKEFACINFPEDYPEYNLRCAR